MISVVKCLSDRKSIHPVKSSATTVFLAHYYSLVAAFCLHQEHCYCHRRDASLKLEGKAAHATITVFLTYLGSMVAACCP